MAGASRHILLITCTALLLGACGLKGPLYLPEERAKQQAEAEQQKKNRATGNPSGTTTAPPASTDTPSPTMDRSPSAPSAGPQQGPTPPPGN